MAWFLTTTNKKAILCVGKGLPFYAMKNELHMNEKFITEGNATSYLVPGKSRVCFFLEPCHLCSIQLV
jgi:hypothetical protein